MASPSPAAIAAIRAAVADWSADDATIAADLNARTVPNPDPEPPPVPAPVDEGALLTLIQSDPATVDRLNDYSHLDRVLDALEGGNRTSIGRWFVLLTSGSAPVIGPDMAARVQAALGATAPDPSWTPDLPWATATLGRPVDADDVAAARPEPTGTGG
jgi:hypothetical protein